MKRNNFTILGENTTLDLDDLKTKLNNNVIVEGTSGCGKTRSVVLPNILNANSSYVVVDAKGIIYNSTKDFLKSKGYNIKVLNLRNLKESNHFNPFVFIKNESDIRRIVELLHPDTATSDPFWDKHARSFLEAYIYSMLAFHSKEDFNIKELIKIATYLKSEENVRKTKLFLERVKPHFAGDKLFNLFDTKFQNIYSCIRTDKTFSSTVAILDSNLLSLASNDLFEMTKDNEFDFTELGKQKTIYYIIVSDTDRSKDFLSNIFFDLAFQELVDYADSRKSQRLKVPVRFIMDDFATNIDVSSNFTSLISSIRSRNISTMIMIQDVAQLEQKFGANYSTVIGNNSTYIYMGNNSIVSAKRIAEYMDKEPNDILTLPYHKEIIMINGRKPIIDKKFDITKHKNYKYLNQNIKLDTYGKNKEIILKEVI